MKLITDDEINTISKNLVAWGSQHFQDYPWRFEKNLWLGLLAEVLLQRTNATHVARKWADVTSRFPSPSSVLSATTEELQSIDKGFGLDRRSRTICELARVIDNNGNFPANLEELTSVFGVGHYTAAAFLSLHLNTRAVLMDSNIARWLCRLFDFDKPKDLRKTSPLWEIADRLTPEKGFRAYNYSVLDFTMTICKPVNPICHSCIFLNTCKFFATKNPEFEES